jgi:hypothetical protein
VIDARVCGRSGIAAAQARADRAAGTGRRSAPRGPVSAARWRAPLPLGGAMASVARALAAPAATENVTFLLHSLATFVE